MLYIICQRQQASWEGFHGNSPRRKMQNLCPWQSLTGGLNNAGKNKTLPVQNTFIEHHGRLSLKKFAIIKVIARRFPFQNNKADLSPLSPVFGK